MKRHMGKPHFPQAGKKGDEVECMRGEKGMYMLLYKELTQQEITLVVIPNVYLRMLHRLFDLLRFVST